MSKFVKDLVAKDIRRRLQNVSDALLVNMVGLDANSNYRLRKDLRAKNIHILVVKNSLAARAMEGTPMARMFDGVAGSAAICWGGEDIVSLAKEITKIIKIEAFAKFEPRGGVLDGEQISATQVAAVAKWPTRAEQLSLLVGQILAPGANLVSQLTSVGGALASQIAEKAKGAEEEAGEAAAPEAVAAEAAAPEGGAVEGEAPAAPSA